MVDENDVLESTILWLVRQGWGIQSYQMATNQPGSPDHRMRVEARIRQLLEVPIKKNGSAPDSKEGLYRGPFPSRSGADIFARKGSKIWVIECKGGGGPRDVRRESGIAQVVIEYGWLHPPSGLAVRTLGLAVPQTNEWREVAKDWLSESLKRKLALWMLWNVGSSPPFQVIAQPPPKSE